MEGCVRGHRAGNSLVKVAGLVVLAMVVVGVVAACGGSDDVVVDGNGAVTPGPSATVDESNGEILGPIDPCGLVTKEEGEASVGTTLGKTRKGNSAPYDVCAYEAIDSAAKAVVHVRSDLPEDEFAAERARTEGLLGETSEVVSGVGDEAHYLGHLLYVRKGDREVVMGVIFAASASATAAQVLAAEKDLTLKALARLP